MNELQTVDALKITLKRQNQQGEALLQVLDHVETIRDDVERMKDGINEDIKDLRDSITLNYQEQQELKSVVMSKAVEMTKNYFGRDGLDYGNHDLFSLKMGQLIHLVYKYLKLRFEVPRYIAIKRVEFHQAKSYVEGLSLNHFKEREIRITQKQKDLLKGNQNEN